MAVVERILELDRGAEEVWQVVREFGGITRWLKGLDGMQLIGEDGVAGAQRVFPMPEGAEPIIEELIGVDDADRVIRYTLTQFMYPMDEHRAAMSVNDNYDGTSTVLWHVEYRSDPETEKTLEGFFGETFESGLESLREFFDRH